LAFLEAFELGVQKLQKRPRKIILLWPSFLQPKKLKTLKNLQINKHKGKSWKKNNETMKLEKLGSLPQVVVLFVCPPPPTRT
jgi:hypothetical protein